MKKVSNRQLCKKPHHYVYGKIPRTVKGFPIYELPNVDSFSLECPVCGFKKHYVMTKSGYVFAYNYQNRCEGIEGTIDGGRGFGDPFCEHWLISLWREQICAKQLDGGVEYISTWVTIDHTYNPMHIILPNNIPADHIVPRRHPILRIEPDE
jgi:hypothetical protein